VKVRFQFDGDEKYTSVHAEPGLYEPSPLKPVICYGTPALRHPDRLHVAGALMFAEGISGPFSVADTEPCSRHVARQIERFFAPLDVFVESQTIATRQTPDGSLAGRLTFAPQDRLDEDGIDPRLGNTIFRLVPEGVGAMFSEQEVVLGTNLVVDTTSAQTALASLRAHLGVMMLYCEDLQISDLHLASGWRVRVASESLQQLRQLLSVVSLKLLW
jgi:hypothetical protein